MEILDFKTEPKVKDILKGYLNSYINKEVLIINDTRSVIKPEVLQYIEFVGGYDQRILPIINNTNIVLSNPIYDNILNYFNNKELSNNINIIPVENIKEKTLTEIITENSGIINQIKELGLKRLVCFIVDEKIEKLAEELGLKLDITSTISKKANDKLELKKYLSSEGFPTINGISTKKIDEITEYYNKDREYFFKDPLGVSGYGFWSNKKNTLEEIIKDVNGKEIIIEEVINKESSPSIQFFIPGNKKEALIFGFTDQILEDGQYFMGNTSPSQYFNNGEMYSEIIKQSNKIIEWLNGIGYIGFGGIDFIITQDKKVYATEVNARFTGATYPAISAMFLTESLESKWKYITQENVKIKIDDYLKNNSIKNRGEKGIFPLCIAPLDNWGKIQVLEML